MFHPWRCTGLPVFYIRSTQRLGCHGFADKPGQQNDRQHVRQSLNGLYRHLSQARQPHALHPELPARVYVRGFVSQYAKYLGLSAERVCESYLQIYDRFVQAKIV